MNIKIKRFDQTLPLPTYEEGAACFDLPCRENTTIEPHSVKLVPLNVAIQVHPGYALLIFVRSSTPLKKGLMLANSVGILDPFFNGDKDEVLAEFYNFTDKPVEIEKGELLTQGMIIKSEAVSWDEVKAFDEKGVGGYSDKWTK